MIYKGNKLKKISFPIGGIGTGSVGVAGNGRLIDWEICNRPNKGSINGFSNFSIHIEDSNGKKYTRALNGDLTEDFIGQYCKKTYEGFGFGPNCGTMCGFPHFRNQSFNGEFPIANLLFDDEDFPVNVKMTAFNPFIPHDEKNSSIPAAFFEFEISNKTEDELKAMIGFSVTNPFVYSINKKDNQYVILSNNYEKSNKDYGEISVTATGDDVYCQEYWYRGRWKDSLVTFWNEFSSGRLCERTYENYGNHDTATVVSCVNIKCGEVKKIRFIMSWFVPNNYNYWKPLKDENDNDVIWKNYYATIFNSSNEIAQYCIDNWDELYNKTLSFKDALYSTSVDDFIKDRAFSSLSVLKSPTVLRLQDGSFYGWEGVHELEGSCEGTCQHVWNYAYALCFLFPKLEQSIRNLELKYNTYETGEMDFRLKLPLGRSKDKFRACVDGQMGTIIKIYRDWKITGDTEWIKTNWDKIKLILEYAWSQENADEWDRDKDGVLEGRQHHTLDMELFGPSSWLEGFYLAALKAASEMADYIGDIEKAEEYKQLYEKGYCWSDKNLFNGKYFIQKINLSDKSITEHFNCSNDYWNDENNEIKYQIASGSEIDQLCAQWHADIIGLGKIFDDEKVKVALENMYKNNVKDSMRDFANPWRIFSLNDEGGAVICDYPKDVYKPKIPIPYCEETMTGFEYQLAGLLISRNYLAEGKEIVKKLFDRFDGEKRNPWNEIECGSNYARSMAAFALIPLFLGFKFDIPNKKIEFNPKLESASFKSFFSIGNCWGVFEKKGKCTEIVLKSGNLQIKELILPYITCVKKVIVDSIDVEYSVNNGVINLNDIIINEKIIIEEV